MSEPHDPVPSLSDASALLLRSASTSLRRALRRRGTPAAVAIRTGPSRRVGADAGLPARPFSGRLLSRHALTCLALLLAIFTTTAGLTWWSWETLQDRRVALAGNDSPRWDGERSLARDLVKRKDGGLTAPARKPPSGQHSLERSTPGSPRSAANSLGLDGRVVAGGVTVVLLAASVGASWLVLRRYRSRAADASAASVPVDPRPSLEHDVPAETGTENGTENATALESREAPEGEPQHAVAAQQDGLVVDGLVVRDDDLLAALLVEQRGPEDGRRAVARTAQAAGTATAVPLLPDTGPEPRSFLPATDGPALAAQARRMEASGPAQATKGELSADEVARERIFDRRVSRKVPHVQPAWAWWSELNAPVTTQELSLTGLCCLFGMSSGSSPQAAPALGEQVRVFFPVNGSTVKATARVGWKQQTAEGVQIGLEFVDLPPDDLSRLRRLLVEAD